MPNVNVVIQPSSFLVDEGTSVTFSISGSLAGTSLSGQPVIYQWLSSGNGGSSFGNIPSATSTSYTVSSINVTFSGSGYNPLSGIAILIDNRVQPSITVGFRYNGSTYGISAINVPSEIFGFASSTRTVTISTAGYTAQSIAFAVAFGNTVATSTSYTVTALRRLDNFVYRASLSASGVDARVFSDNATLAIKLSGDPYAAWETVNESGASRVLRLLALGYL